MSTLNKSIVRKVKLTEEKTDYSYWINQSAGARLAALESIRNEYNNWKFHDQSGFQRVIELLNKHKVKYLVVGGYALAFHGHPRYTKDIDFWLWVDKTNAERVMRVLHDFGFSSLGLGEEDFLKPGYVVQLGQPPGRIDLLTSVTGLDFEKCYASKVHITIQGTEVDFIDLDNFKKNKKAVGRYQDLADLENLK